MIGNEHQTSTKRPRSYSFCSPTVSDVTQNLDSLSLGDTKVQPHLSENTDSYQYIRDYLFHHNSYKKTFGPEQGFNTYYRLNYIRKNDIPLSLGGDK